MLRKIFKTGNSMVVSLPKEYLEPLGVTEGSGMEVELDLERKRLVLQPVAQPLGASIDPEFSRQVNEFIERYRTALETLAGR